VLKEETVKLMRTPAFGGNVVNCGFGQYWGLSMRVIKTPTPGGTEVMPVDSFGWSGAYGTHFFINPADGLTAIYMMNCSTANGAGAITAREFEIDIFGE
jgi:CubicO group peptidase (beta-lactamase class C family)